MAHIKKTEHGTWRVRYRDPTTNTRSQTFKTKTDAKQFLIDIQARIQHGTWTDPKHGKTRLDDWITLWHQTRHNRPSTQARDHAYITNLITPNLGHHQLRTLTPAHIRRWITTLTNTHAAATVHKAHQLLRAALQQAVTDGYIPRNPTDNTPLPRLEKPDHRYLTITEVHQLADAIDPRYATLVYTGALTGLRPGELAALRIDDLDLLRKRLTVTQTATDVAGHLTYGPPKTAAARRTLTIPHTLIDLLAAHLVDQTGTDLVFTSPDGHGLRIGNFRRRTWKPAVAMSVGEPMRIHDLRHTHAALAIREGIHPKVLQARLGHTSIATTLNVYGGLFEGFDEGLADALDDAFSGHSGSDSGQIAPTSVVTLPTK